ncbi:MAG: uroporphyrinogen-III synthase [Bdellovibrionales bacterium]|nr:uroporphyrinogen-III synthase [Bdellovibrionales bacterium]
MNTDNIKILFTRSLERKKSTMDLCIKKKLSPIFIPCIEYTSLNASNLLDVLENLEKFDAIIVTSQTAFDFFSIELEKHKIKWPINPSWIVLGEKSFQRVQRSTSGKIVYESSWKTSFDVASYIEKSSQWKNKKILILRPLESVSQFPTWLENVTRNTTELVLYQTSIHAEGRKEFLSKFPIHCDWIVFMSPSAVEAFFSFKKGDEISHWIFNRGILLASIGPTTSQKLREFEVPVSLEASSPSLETLLDEVKNFE